jgi:hypothetical protein
MSVIREVLSSQTLPHAVLPAHGPGCQPLTGLRSARFPDEPRYICSANCPRRNALAHEVGSIPRDLDLDRRPDLASPSRLRDGGHSDCM